MNKRFEWIDNLRGMAIVSMILYHTAWDLVYLYGVNWKWYHSDAAFLWQQSICWTFIFLSEFCWSFHRRPLKQGVVISIAGVLVSIVTCFFDAGSRILFGVITLLGAVTFLMIPLEKVLKKIKPIKGLWMMFLLFAVTYSVNEGSIGFFGWKIYALPTIIYDGFFSTFLGFTENEFYSADYFSIFPWCFLFFTGYYGFLSWKERGCPGLLGLNYKIPIITKMGKHSMMFYLLHQPCIYLLLEIAYKR